MPPSTRAALRCTQGSLPPRISCKGRCSKTVLSFRRHCHLANDCALRFSTACRSIDCVIVAMPAKKKRSKSMQGNSNAHQHTRVPPCDETAAGLRSGTATVIGTRSRLALASHRHEPVRSFQRTLLALPLLCRPHRSGGGGAHGVSRTLPLIGCATTCLVRVVTVRTRPVLGVLYKLFLCVRKRRHGHTFVHRTHSSESYRCTGNAS